MNTVELLEAAMDLAQRAGYQIRQDWLGGNGGGGCMLKGRRMLFVDLALGPVDQLEHVLDALRYDPDAAQLPMPGELRQLLAMRKSA